MKRNISEAVGGIFLIALFFIISSYVVQNNIDYFRTLIGESLVGMIAYVGFLILATVIAPINGVPLVPVASNVWGWFLTGVLSIVGWALGAMIAFSLARKYGVPLVRQFVSLEKMAKFEMMIPQGNIFWSIVFLRMAVPVDVLSYILGLFSHIKFRTYTLATLIGVAPFAFIFAFLGSLPFYYQVIGILLAGLMLLIGYLVRRYVKRRKIRRNLTNASGNIYPSISNKVKED